MRKSDQRAQCLFGDPPKGRAQRDAVEQQGERLSGHDDEGRQRDRDDVRERAIKARLVEVEQRDRCERDFDDKAGDEQSRNGPTEADRPGLLAAHQKGTHRTAFVQRDNRGNGGEA